MSRFGGARRERTGDPGLVGHGGAVVDCQGRAADPPPDWLVLVAVAPSTVSTSLPHGLVEGSCAESPL